MVAASSVRLSLPNRMTTSTISSTSAASKWRPQCATPPSACCSTGRYHAPSPGICPVVYSYHWHQRSDHRDRSVEPARLSSAENTHATGHELLGSCTKWLCAPLVQGMRSTRCWFRCLSVQHRVLHNSAGIRTLHSAWGNLLRTGLPLHRRCVQQATLVQRGTPSNLPLVGRA